MLEYLSLCCCNVGLIIQTEFIGVERKPIICNRVRRSWDGCASDWVREAAAVAADSPIPSQLPPKPAGVAQDSRAPATRAQGVRKFRDLGAHPNETWLCQRASECLPWTQTAHHERLSYFRTLAPDHPRRFEAHWAEPTNTSEALWGINGAIERALHEVSCARWEV